MEMMIETYGCVGQSISYPNNNSICADRSLHPSWRFSKNAPNNAAKPAKKCHTHYCKEDQQCKKRYLKLNFLFNRLEIERFDHEAKYESVSMFSYIGGYMGMWLGISLISLFDFLETLVRLCIYPFRNSKKFKKKSILRSFDI
ncbi:uncharacterized protein TNCT_25531 [Trichonephila clavata]|uniref:Uncharacterized protein n=1 Tax=Trichonephila clavata TaxID=2740835 RepID=A0A8X6IE29_TRICU|nr:uncharacterized protein TNCT_25531 [Trichonephila clavata]